MTLVLTVHDAHSGLSTLKWTLSTHPLTDDVGQGAVGVQRLDNMVTYFGLAIPETLRRQISFVIARQYVVLSVLNHESINEDTCSPIAPNNRTGQENKKQWI